MSWSSVTQDVSGSELEAAIDGMVLGDYVTHNREEAQEQLDAGKAAAKAMLASGAIGQPSGASLYRISISGHANTGHLPEPGWANEMLVVNVYEIAIASPAQPEEAATETGAEPAS